MLAAGKNLARKLLPVSLRRTIWYVRKFARQWRAEWRRAWLRDQWRTRTPGSVEVYLDFKVRINNGETFYTSVKDIVWKQIYHFEAQRPNPLIIDCGSNIGLSILYFKAHYPNARILGFEPDPVLYPYLEDNIARNHLTAVQLFNAALDKSPNVLTFYSDGEHSSTLEKYLSETPPAGWTKYEVPCVRLYDYLTEPVDFLKMNIEGAEWEVLADSEGRLRQVREMAIEYHHLPHLPRTLHHILGLLDRLGFEYLLYDFDEETNRTAVPPFRLAPDSSYFLIIYAKRKSAE